MKFQLILVGLAVVTIWLAVVLLPDDKLHVVFCNVGQGDSALVTYRNWQLLIDSGPGNEVIRCLGRHMPFYDRQLEAVVLTHENKDHSEGLKAVIKRYQVKYWEPKLRQGQMITLGPVKFEVEWPLENNFISDENDLGIVGRIIYGSFDVLMTADVNSKDYAADKEVEVVKMPHHGSRLSISKEWIEAAKPKLAVISVGKNSFGHPAPEVVAWLKEVGAKVMRTDQDGDIEIISDGKSFRVK